MVVFKWRPAVPPARRAAASGTRGGTAEKGVSVCHPRDSTTDCQLPPRVAEEAPRLPPHSRACPGGAGHAAGHVDTMDTGA
ncbi:hypothetical protein E2C01_045175 [Portunus trituberculatus]|uniref:Uncharacterized protein n=1 Tax=Portunus trituberculatus TaxID=210409 RepID=A0A5B7FV16_PORTR|nr:hypothetical protein [Portunus trituberculatus]